ncbi:YncE family protein [Patescibacteria group bacterium]
MKKYKKVVLIVLISGFFFSLIGYQFFGVYFSEAKRFREFGEVTVEADFKLDGRGRNIDSLAFWENSNRKKTLLFVTAKGNERVEVWKYPFKGNERSSIGVDGRPNGVAVDQKNNELFVTDSINREVIVYSLPDREELRRFGSGIIGEGENSIDIYHWKRRGRDQVWAYVTDDENVYAFDAEAGDLEETFDNLSNRSIETIMVDSYHKAIYVPEEDGGDARKPGVFAYKPDGRKYNYKGKNYFGRKDVFDRDEEGITMYKCLDSNDKDNGRGFIIVSDQRGSETDFEFFDRIKWRHLGTLKIKGVGGTDGIASIQDSLRGYSEGLFAAVDDDRKVAIVGWDTILEATGLDCDKDWDPDTDLFIE